MPEPRRLSCIIHGDAAMREAGATLARALPDASGPPVVIALDGELGSGKTTLTSGLLAALGIAPPHRSPTYTLIEPYEVAGRRISHLDLYRLRDPRELEDVALRDLYEPGAVLIVEWASRAGEALAPRDIDIVLGLGATETSRSLEATAKGPSGEALLARLASSTDPQLVCVSR